MRLYRITSVLLILATFLLYACSNSEYVDEYGVPVSMYAPDENADAVPPEQDSASKPDTLTEFPPSGFFAKPFTVSLPEKMNCETGGFVPTKNSPALKTIHINSSTTIRCASLLNDSSLTTETIRTYLFEKKPTIPTVFITTDPNSLFDPDTGIYMEGPNADKNGHHYGANYWQDKEIPIFIELTELFTYVPAFSKYAGLKIFGNYSRTKPKKSVAITFREKYGDKKLDYKLFSELENVSKYKSFVLRNLGSSFGRDYIRDRLSSSLSDGLGIDYQQGRFVIVYYNGKYFGIHDMRERSNEYYFEAHYGINHNNINLLKADNSASSGTPSDYISLMNWLNDNDLSKEENYAYIISKIDIDNFINYMQIEIFANNRDWPGNNLKKWNAPPFQTQWKWFLYDIDVSFGLEYGIIENNIFEFLTSEGKTNYANTPRHTLLFRSLLKNNNFKATFINRMTTLLQMNLERSRILTKIEKLMAEIKTEIPRDQKRWSLNTTRMNEELEIIKQFAQNRQSVIIQNLQNYFKLGEVAPVKLSTTGNGIILVHNLPLDQTNLTIPFFKKFPVTISAEPVGGSNWSHWSDGDSSSTRIIYPEEYKELVAIFK